MAFRVSLAVARCWLAGGRGCGVGWLSRTSRRPWVPVQHTWPVAAASAVCVATAAAAAATASQCEPSDDAAVESSTAHKQQQQQQQQPQQQQQGDSSTRRVRAGPLLTVLGIGGGVLLFFAPFMIIPWLPRKVFGALPWLATSPRRIKLLLSRLQERGLVHTGRRFVDLGSGDGVAVIEAARQRMQSVGVELNPSLVLLAKYGAWRAGVGSDTKFILGNMFEHDTSPYDVVLVFGVKPLMQRVEDKLVAELSGKSSRAYIVSHKFELPNWKPWLVEDDLFFYETPFVQRRLLDSEDDDDNDDAATAADATEQARRKEQAQRSIHDDDDD